MTYTVKQERISHQQARIERHSDQSAANAQLVVTIPAGGVPRRIDRISVAYSGSVSKTATIGITSGVGSGFNETLPPIVITSGTNGSYVPTTDTWISGDDVLVITAPAGGSTFTSTIVARLEEAGM
jgi:hypothetical protein